MANMGMTISSQNPREAAQEAARQTREAAQEAAQQAREDAREAAQEAAEEARDAAENARDVARAKLEAAKAEREAEQIGDGSTGVVTITKDGVTTVLTEASPQAIATALGMPNPYGNDNDGPFVVGGLGIVSTAIVFIVGMILYHRRNSRGAGTVTALPKDLTERLTRMEAGIDAMAVEVERISEGQRFTTRLLADRPIEEVRRG